MTRNAGRRRGMMMLAMAVGASAALAWPSAAQAATKYWDINGTNSGARRRETPGGTWSTTAANWNTDQTGAGGGTISAWNNAAGDVAEFSAGTDATGTFAVTVNGSITAGNLTFQDGTVALSGAQVILTSSAVVTVATGHTATINSVIEGSAGLRKSGSGTLILGANFFTGAVAIDAGTLQISVDDALGDVNNTVVFNGGTLATTSGITTSRAFTFATGGGTFAPASGTTLTLNHQVSGGGALNMTGGGTLFLNFGLSSTFVGTITIGSGTLRCDSANAKLGDVNNDITLDGGLLQGSGALSATRTINVEAGGGFSPNSVSDLTINGVITGTGSLTKSGAGILTLAGSSANTHTGGMTVSSGTLRLAADNRLADGGVVSLANVAGTVFDLNGHTETIGGLSGGGSTGGNVVLGIGALTVNQSSNSTFSGAISGSGSIVKAGSGSLAFYGTNTYSGGTSINGGTLEVSSESNLGHFSGPLSLNGGMLRLFGPLSGANRKITLAAGGGTIDTNGFTGDFGAIDPGNFTKNGLGTMHVKSISANQLTINAGRMHVRASGDSTASTSVLTAAPSILGSSQLDLDDNSMVLNYTGASPLVLVRVLLVNGRGPAGFGNATWNGVGGITSSKASIASQGLGGTGDGVNLAVGYAENSALPLGSYTSFKGQPVGSSSILIKFTRGADADLDGVVGNSDVTIVGGKFGAAGSGQWYFGDFDYSGACDNADVTALGGLFNPSSAPLSSEQLNAQFGEEFVAAFESGASGAAAVPEPSCVLVVGAAGLGLMKRRRRGGVLREDEGRE